MLELYRIPNHICFFLYTVCDFGIIVQMLAVAYNFCRYQRSWIQKLENIFEIFVLIQLFLHALLMAEIKSQAIDGITLFNHFLLERRIVFCLLCITGIALRIMRRGIWMIPALLASFAMMPVAEFIFRSGFLVVYTLVFLCWIARAVYIVKMCNQELHTKISTFSVKEAIDSMHAGILFYEPDGLILLCNRQMVQLMMTLTGEIQHSGTDFWLKLHRGTILPESKRENGQAQLIYRLPDNTLWMFSIHKIPVGRKNGFMLFATDQTEQWEIMQDLRHKNEILKQREQQIRTVLRQLPETCRKEELFRAKSWTHDVLGQRISLLLRALRENKKPDELLLQSFMDGLTAGQTDYGEKSPAYALKQLVKIYRGLGVFLQIDGNLPDQPEHADTFVKIATECVSNAVRHGYATRVSIHFWDKQVMKVENNGILPEEPFIEGSGIREMRRKAEALGGRLEVRIKPRFHIIVTIPKEENL